MSQSVESSHVRSHSSSEQKDGILVHWLKLREKVSFWRVLALVAICVALGSISANDSSVSTSILEGDDDGPEIISEPHIARIDLEGVILSSSYREKVIKRLIDSQSDQVQALIVVANTPGGGIVASEVLMQQIGEFSDTGRPVVYVMNDVAASGGYMAALGADRIFARENTITASIGAITRWLQVSELLEEYGVRSVTVASGDVKGGVDPLGPANPKKQQAMQEIVNQMGEWFLAKVKAERKLSDSVIEILNDGRVVRGVEARELGLIDQIGGVDDALGWLQSEKNIDDDTLIETYSLIPPISTWSSHVRSFLSELGFPIASSSEAGVSHGIGWALWVPAL